jgi:hypothetical protein
MSAVITNPPTPGTPQQPTTPPAQPAQQPPGAPGQPAPQPAPPQNPPDMGGMTPEQLRQYQIGVQPGTPQAAPQFQPQPVNPYVPQRQQDGQFVIALPTGQRYIGHSPEEAIQRLAEAQVNASQTISNVTAERDRFRTALTGDQPGQGQAKFDKAAYMELQQVDPILAANYLDQFRFGLNSPAEVPQTFQRMNANAMEYEMAREVNTFKALAPDFPGTQAAVDAVMQTLRANNIPFKAENLRMIHNELATRGVYQRVATQPQYQMPQPGAQPPQPMIPGQPPAQLIIPSFEPQGNYGFGPNGFGSAPQPAAQFQPPAPQPPQYAPPQYPPAAAQAPQYAPQPPQQAYYPPTTAAYPGMPPAAAAPMPPPPQGASPVPGAQQPNENQLNLMTAQALREVVEQRLQ